MRGHAPTQPPSCRQARLCGCWAQPCAVCRRSRAPQPPQPLAPAAASTAAEAVEEVVDRRALLAAAAADGRPAGVEVDGGNHWPALDDAGLAGRVADGRDAPVKRG